jgi:hypothetical protein
MEVPVSNAITAEEPKRGDVGGVRPFPLTNSFKRNERRLC